MKLFQHDEFEQLVIAAARHFGSAGLSAAAIEKDYFVTEALRLIAAAYGEKVIFKGGTSLSKGWGLIQRFSEDVDIFLDPVAFNPRLGKRAVIKTLVGCHSFRATGITIYLENGGTLEKAQTMANHESPRTTKL